MVCQLICVPTRTCHMLLEKRLLPLLLIVLLSYWIASPYVIDPTEEDTTPVPVFYPDENVATSPEETPITPETAVDNAFFRRAYTTPFGLSDTVLLWLRADVGLVYGGANDSIISWADQSGRGLDPEVPSSISEAIPSLSSELINFNPAIHFDKDELNASMDTISDYLELSDSVRSIFF